jgi:hypothetical protein
MYVNGKMRPVETIPEMGVGEIKENDGQGEYNCDIIQEHLYYKNIYKCNNVPPVQQ